MKKNRFCFTILLFSLALFPLTAERHRSKFTEDDFYRYIYLLTGVKMNPDITYFESLPSDLARVLSGYTWSRDGSIIRVFDRTYTDFQGLFDVVEAYSTSSDSGAWVKTLSLPEDAFFSKEEPSELKEAQKEIEKIIEETGSAQPEGTLEGVVSSQMESPSGGESSLQSEGSKGGDGSSQGNVSSQKEGSLESDSKDKNSPSQTDSLSATEDSSSEETGSKTPVPLPELQSTENSEDEKLVNGSLLKKNTPSGEKRLKNSESFLRLHVFEDELLSLQTFDDQSSLVFVTDKKMCRKFFDKNHRLTKKENWSYGTAIENIRLLSTETFLYKDEESLRASEKNIDTSLSHQNFQYDEKGRVILIKNFSYPANFKDEKSKNEKESKEEEEKPYLLLNKTSLKYTENGKVSEKLFVEYEYSSEKYGKILSKDERKDVWIYKVDDGDPDYFYYENDVLRMKTEYSSQNDWISTMYFQNGFTVENHWKEGMHRYDLYYLDGNLVRRTDYEAE